MGEQYSGSAVARTSRTAWFADSRSSEIGTSRPTAFASRARAPAFQVHPAPGTSSRPDHFLQFHFRLSP